MSEIYNNKETQSDIQKNSIEYPEMKIDSKLKKALEIKKELEKEEDPTQNQDSEVQTPAFEDSKAPFFILGATFLAVVAFILSPKIIKLFEKGRSNEE
ncbi:hypothetical protein BKH41_00680 [Helicobacter sp. 12S02232-10]|uniref:hypothetical protein n=1 Tax=Helicobacter sp. 12S02232-10 TaxID=1476197 RepID=UPI000BA74C2E|nr:hypothetical protein [Helicobacter sp. 12S02232-10]PAF49850.1 hypothetical protein BKH41_00680 [Helicobacter sp. 12S02232-10]